MKTIAIAALALLPALVSASDLIMIAESESQRFFTNPKTASSKGTNVTFSVIEYPSEKTTSVTVDCSNEYQGFIYLDGTRYMWRHDGEKVYDHVSAWGCIVLLPISNGTY